MIRVIHVISDTNIGGAGRIMLAYLKNRDKTSFDITVALPFGSLLIAELEKMGIRYHTVEYIAEKSFDFKAVKALRLLFEAEKPEVVHTHAALSARFAARLYGKCRIVHTRHSVFEQSRAKKVFPLKQILGFINNFFSDIIIAVSPAAKLNITETGTNPDKVKIIFNGVDALVPLGEDEKNRKRVRFDLMPGDFVCSIVARLEKDKGHEYVLKAAKLLKQSNRNIRILIAGTGSELENLKKATADAELDNCIFTGFIDDVRDIFGITDLQLNASIATEATSLSLLEGMSLGVPAVVSDFGGNPFVVLDGVNGFVVPAGDGAAIYDAITKISNDKTLYEKMKQKSIERYNEKFKVSVMAESIEDIYRKLARGEV